MSDDLTFSRHNMATVASSKTVIGWIMRSLKTRVVKPTIIFEALLLFKLEYYWVLAPLFNVDEIAD